MTEHKYFNGKKYLLNNNRWTRTTHPRILLSHDIWNYYHSEDKIIKGDGNVIHHDNKDKLDDRIENLQKMTKGEHSSLHNSGKGNCHYKNGRATKENLKEYRKSYNKANYKSKYLFSFRPEINIQYSDRITVHLKTNHITFIHGWSYNK